MTVQTFPSIIPSYSLIKIPTFRTIVINYGNKVEQRVAMNEYPQYQLKLKFENIDIDSADQIMAFFESRKGSFEAFYFVNSEETKRARRRKPSTAYALNSIVGHEPDNGHSYKCVVAGTTSSTGLVSLNSAVNTLTVDGGVTWKENTYLVRFMEDSLNVEYFQFNLYNLSTVDLIEVGA